MKKLITIILCTLMVLTLAPIKANAEDKKTYAETTYGKVEYVYKDEYFSGSAKTVDWSLASMSMVLAGTGFGTYDAELGPRSAAYAYTLLTTLGFEAIETNEDFKKATEKDSFGVLCAYKKIGNDTLLVVLPRSGGYENEWVSNFTLGASGVAQGFGEAGKKMVDFTNAYCEDHKSNLTGTVKVWVTGYSRGAAAANIAAASFADKYGQDNVFAYTFETPNTINIDTVTLEKAKSYANIHNFINPVDFVTILPPAEWGFTRYGVDIEIAPKKKTASNTAIFDAYYQSLLSLVNNGISTSYYISESTVIDLYNHVYGKDYKAKALNVNATTLSKVCLWNTNWELPKWKFVEETLIKDSDESIYELAHNLVTALADAAGSRKNYVNRYQSPARILAAFTLGDYNEDNRLRKFWYSFEDKIQENFGSLSAAVILKDAVSLNKLFTKIVKETLEENDLDSADYTSLSKSLIEACPLATGLIIDCAISGWGDTICNTAYNFDSLKKCHYVEINYAWVKMQDPNFNKDNPTAVQDFINGNTLKKVIVTVKKVESKTKLLKIKTTSYQVTITTEGKAETITYKNGLTGSEKTGTSFTSSTAVKDLTITVVDGNGDKSTWYFNGTTTVQR